MKNWIDARCEKRSPIAGLPAVAYGVSIRRTGCEQATLGRHGLSRLARASGGAVVRVLYGLDNATVDDMAQDLDSTANRMLRWPLEDWR